MTISSKALVKSKTLENSTTTQYTASNVTAVIESPTVTNVSASAATVSFWLVASGDSAADDNLIVDAKSIAAGATVTISALIGKVIESGDFLAASAGTASAITLNISGLEMT